MSDRGALMLAVPLPAFHKWMLLTDARECPDGFAIIARLGTGRRVTVSDQVALPAPVEAMPSLEELVAIYATLNDSQRAELLEAARKLAQAERLTP